MPVRVLDLPPEMKHTTVIEFLTQYGEVQSVTRERWKIFFPGVYNGVRILHIKLTKPIPSFVTISGHMTSISYPWQQKTCRWCERDVHPGQKCNVSENQPSSAPQTVIPSNENSTGTIKRTFNFNPTYRRHETRSNCKQPLVRTGTTKRNIR